MGYAVPYKQIISQIYEGRAKYQKGSINPSFKNYSNTSLPAYTYDTKKAKALLKQAGVTNPTFTLDVSTATPDLVDASVLIKSYAEKAGFTVNIKQDTAADFGTGRTNAAYQALIYRNRAQVQTPTYAMTTFFKPGNDLSNPSRWQDADNTKFQNILTEAAKQPSPLTVQAGKDWEAAEKILINNNVEDLVAYIQPSQIYSTKVKGYAYRSENAIDFAHLTVSK
jgi:peptide/nickel transport system substrate-binding protein